jgi:hypothetical protein
VRMSIAPFALTLFRSDNEQSASACLISHMTAKLGFNLSQKPGMFFGERTESSNLSHV